MSRKTGLLAATSLAVLAVVMALLMLGERQQTVAGYEQTASQAQETSLSTPVMTHTVSLPIVVRNVGPAYTPPFGVIMYGSVNDAAGLPAMEDAGARWVSTVLNWGAIEPTKGVYNWSSFDIKAQNAQAAGMELIVLFSGNPTWAAELVGGPVYDIQDLVDFVSRMAERYDCDGVEDAPGQPCVDYWSFYAEPDNGSLWRAQLQHKGYWGHNGAGYAAMLSQVSPAIHQANPRAKVLNGGLAYDWFEDDENPGPFVRSFLGDTLEALNALGGARQYLDGVAFHYYPISQSFPTVLDKVAEIRAIMTSHGAGDLPLVCPEMGYWSSPKFNSSEQKQASWLVQTVARGLSMGVQPLSYYEVFDRAVAGSDDDLYPDSTSGLLRVDGSPKPAYHAYRTMARELDTLRYQGTLQAAGAEGYLFGLPGGPPKTVLWSQSGTVQVPFPYSRLRLVYMEGAEFDIRDGQGGTPGDRDGKVDGKIVLDIYENRPFYVEQK